MDVKQLSAAILKRREKSVDMGDGKKIIVRRPPETAMGPLIQDVGEGKVTFRVGVEEVKKYVVGWEGYTEADFYGAGVGSTDTAVPFDSALWAVMVEDDTSLMAKVSSVILDAVVAHYETKAEVAGN
jgi:hypothetical protein